MIAVASDRAFYRFLQFFKAQIRNPNTRRAFARAVVDFLSWLKALGVDSIAGVSPLNVASCIAQQTRSEVMAQRVGTTLRSARRAR